MSPCDHQQNAPNAFFVNKLNEYQAKEEARRLLTAKLRADRLAREEREKAKRDRKRGSR